MVDGHQLEKERRGETMATVEEETYMTILEIETSEVETISPIEKLDKVIKKLEEWNVEDNSEIMIQTKMTKCLVYMGKGEGEKCLEWSEEILKVLNDTKTVNSLHTNVRQLFMIQANVFFSYALLFFNIVKKQKSEKIIWKKICENKKMLQFLQNEKNMTSMKVDIGTLEEQVKNIEYQYYIVKEMFGDAVKLGSELLREMEMSHGKSHKSYKDFFQKLIYVMWWEETNMPLVQKSQLELLAECSGNIKRIGLGL